MTILNILQYPHAHLRDVAKPVKAVDDRIYRLSQDMLETMYKGNGIGLAATQVDVHERLLVMDISEERNQPIVVINPQLIWASEETQIGEEGCLSIPGVYDKIERHSSVHVQCLDEKGTPKLIKADGLQAVCLQHEMDHLMGKLFIDYLSLLKRNRIKTKMLKQQKKAK